MCGFVVVVVVGVVVVVVAYLFKPETLNSCFRGHCLWDFVLSQSVEKVILLSTQVALHVRVGCYLNICCSGGSQRVR